MSGFLLHSLCLWFVCFQSIVLCTPEVEQCTERFMQLSLLVKKASQNNSAPLNTRLLNDELRVLQEYQFNCSSTNITSLILGIDVRIAANPRRFFPSVQVFRPNGSIVNQYDLVPGSERTIYYSTSNVSTSGVYEYPLNPPIPVMSGDLLAVSQPPDTDSIVGVYIINSSQLSIRQPLGTTSFTLEGTISNELVLVYPITEGGTACINSLVNETTVRESSLQINPVSSVMMRSQIIYPNVAFSCSGNITKWIYSGLISTNNRQPELQIWRQLNSSNYKKAGSSTLKVGNATMHHDVYEFIPKPPLSFQKGDIFGIFNPSNNQVDLQEQIGNGPLNLIYTSLSHALSKITTTTPATTKANFPLVTVEIKIKIAATTMTTSSTDMSSPSDMTTSSQVAQATASSFVLSVMATATPRYDSLSTVLSDDTTIVSVSSTDNTVKVPMTTLTMTMRSSPSPIMTYTTVSPSRITTNIANTISISSSSVDVSTTSTVSTVTSGTEENTGSLPAVIGGLIAAITVLLILLALCFVIMLAMAFHFKKRKSVELESENQYAEIEQKELAFRNVLYTEVELQENSAVEMASYSVVPPQQNQYDKLRHFPDPQSNTKERQVVYEDMSQFDHEGQCHVVKNITYEEVQNEDGMIDNALYAISSMQAEAKVNCVGGLFS